MRAYELSEQFDTPVLLRLSTRISHSRSIVETGERQARENLPYVRNVAKNVMMPAMAKARHIDVEALELKRFANGRRQAASTVPNTTTNPSASSARARHTMYAREALGNKVSYFKLGMVNPLPVESLKAFAAQVGRLIVIEELGRHYRNALPQTRFGSGRKVSLPSVR